MINGSTYLRIVVSGSGPYPDPAEAEEGQVLVGVYSESVAGTLESEVFEAVWISQDNIDMLDEEKCIWRGRYTGYDLNGTNIHWWMLVYDERGDIPAKHRLELLMESQEPPEPPETPDGPPRTWSTAHNLILMDLAAERVRRLVEGAEKGEPLPEKWSLVELRQLYATALAEISKYARRMAAHGKDLDRNMRWLAKMIKLRRE